MQLSDKPGNSAEITSSSHENVDSLQTLNNVSLYIGQFFIVSSNEITRLHNFQMKVKACSHQLCSFLFTNKISMISNTNNARLQWPHRCELLSCLE